MLVSSKLRHFPAHSWNELDLNVLSPDEFLLDQLDLYPDLVARALSGQVRDAAKPKLTLEELLRRLRNAGAPSFAGRAQAEIGSGGIDS